MRIWSRRTGAAVILDAEGPLTLTASGGELRRRAAEEARRGARNLLLNLARVTDLDCAGISELVSIYNELRELGGSVKLLNLQRFPRTLLEKAGLLKVFETFDDEREASASFEEAASAPLPAGQLAARPGERLGRSAPKFTGARE
jgi:anti-anti-sigma factor